MTKEYAIQNLETIKRMYTWSTGADDALDMAIEALKAQDVPDKKSELKPCPFCGCGEGNLYIVTVEQHGFDTVGIFCNGCKQTVILEENEWEGDNDQSRKKAIKAWNRRAKDESQNK